MADSARLTWMTSGFVHGHADELESARGHHAGVAGDYGSAGEQRGDLPAIPVLAEE